MPTCLDENNEKSDFSSYVNKYRGSSEAGTSDEGSWDVLRGDLRRLQTGVVGG